MTAHRRSYTEYPVCEELRSCLDCFWSSGDAPVPAGVRYPILPDGCVDIVFRYSARPEGSDRLGRSASLEEVLIVGPMTRAVWMSQDPTQAWMGVRFHPGRAFRFLARPLNALVDITPAASQLLDQRQVAALRQAGRGYSIDDRLRILEDVLFSLSRLEHSPNDLIAGIDRIRASGGSLRIDELCSDIGISRQHLGREFGKHVGLSPKSLSRIFRFREVLRRIRQGLVTSWADLAVELGYYDQAHLISDFSRFSGISPDRYRRLARLGGD